MLLACFWLLGLPGIANIGDSQVQEKVSGSWVVPLSLAQDQYSGPLFLVELRFCTPQAYFKIMLAISYAYRSQPVPDQALSPLKPRDAARSPRTRTDIGFSSRIVKSRH